MPAKPIKKQTVIGIIEDYVCHPGQTYKELGKKHKVSHNVVGKYLNKYFGKGEKPQVLMSKMDNI